ncbi:hypothetical protein B4134_3571 [Bacillus safensis]|nr:hypothetical protein B4134_3571 [Bacillus safensis]
MIRPHFSPSSIHYSMYSTQESLHRNLKKTKKAHLYEKVCFLFL